MISMHDVVESTLEIALEAYADLCRSQRCVSRDSCYMKQCAVLRKKSVKTTWTLGKSSRDQKLGQLDESQVVADTSTAQLFLKK